MPPLLAKASADPLVNALADLQAVKFETLTPKPLAEYGLGEGSMLIGVRAEGKPYGLRIGKAAPDGNRYAQLTDDANKAIFLLPGSLATQLEMPALDRLDKNLLTLEPPKSPA